MPIMKKTRVVEKFRSFLEYVKANDGHIGTKQRGLDMNLNNACNLRCKHCFTNSPLGDHVKDMLPLEKIADIADQADELGIFEWDLQGGELLLRPEILFDVLKAIKPERFYLYVTTNGYFLDADMAKKLADSGVDRVSVSIDSMEAKEHDEFRGREGSWQRAIDALEHVKAAGMTPFMNITVGHYNALGDDVEKKIRQVLQSQFSRMDLISRQEFDVQTQVLLRTREKLNQLELRINALETMPVAATKPTVDSEPAPEPPATNTSGNDAPTL